MTAVHKQRCLHRQTVVYVVVNKHAHVNLSLIKIQEKHSSWDPRQAIGTKDYVPKH